MATTTAPQSTTADRAATYFTKGLSWAFFAGALAVSYIHIVHVFHMLGLTDWQRYIVPAAIDGLMVLGRIGMAANFAPEARATGKRLFLSMLALSLVANVAAGLESVGGMLWGGLVIMGLVITEWYGPKLRPRPLSPQERAAITRKTNAEATARAKATASAKRKARKAPAATAQRAARDIDAELAAIISTVPRKFR